MGSIEKLDNPYFETAIANYGEELYNVYPEFAVFEEARDVILELIEVSIV